MNYSKKNKKIKKLQISWANPTQNATSIRVLKGIFF